MDVVNEYAKLTVFVGNRVPSQEDPSQDRQITRECDHSAKGPFFRSSGTLHVRAHTLTWQ